LSTLLCKPISGQDKILAQNRCPGLIPKIKVMRVPAGFTNVYNKELIDGEWKNDYLGQLKL